MFNLCTSHMQDVEGELYIHLVAKSIYLILIYQLYNFSCNSGFRGELPPMFELKRFAMEINCRIIISIQVFRGIAGAINNLGERILQVAVKYSYEPSSVVSCYHL